MPFIDNQRTKIYRDEQGQDAPILRIMGLGWSSDMWQRTRPVLSPRYRTIAFDNRGAGRSDVPEGPYSIAEMACDAARVLDAAGVESAHLFGESMGGMIAQEFALQYPMQEPGVKERCAVANREVSVQRAKENKGETMGRVEANPSAPHCGFFGHDG